MPDANYLNEVVRLAAVTGPTEQPDASVWKALEDELRVTLPADFKDIVSALGAGWFGVGLGLKNPCASSEYARLSRKHLLHYKELVSETQRRTGLRLYPEPDGLISVGDMDRQSLLLRPTKGGRQFRSAVWWDMDYHIVHHTRMSVSRFLHDLYLGRIRTEWAKRMRDYVWRAGTAPFFTQWRRSSD